MKVFNTLTNQKEEFIPIEEGKVRMYVCGPTVYDYIHIGNARPMIVFDAVRRYLEYKGYEVKYVSNFTDIDDKIIKRAQEEKISALELSGKFIKEAIKDMKGLNVKPSTESPKATEEIPEIIEMIHTLIMKGYAYEKNGTVYFRTCRSEGYGKLSNKKLDELEAGIRIAINEEKENPMDFVLWKPKKEGEPAWSSPWSEGRPGWHIECSAMSKKYLGEEIDIHAGGEDLVFPHHENEIAQSEAANGKQFAKYWMHNRFINMEGKKMAKSEGNFFTVREISQQYSYKVLRFFMLSAHYRSPVNFSKKLMNAAKNGLERIETAVTNLEFLLKSVSDQPLKEEEKNLLEKMDELEKKFETAMEDDFNTADAISVIFELVKAANSVLTEDSSREAVFQIKNKIEKLCEILGIEIKQNEELLDEEIEKLIQERQNARTERNFKKADEIRDLLVQKGILLEDTREGVKWKRK